MAEAEGMGGGVAEVLERMRTLAVNRGDAQRRSKRDRAALRSVFRSTCAAAEVPAWPGTFWHALGLQNVQCCGYT